MSRVGKLLGGLGLPAMPADAVAALPEGDIPVPAASKPPDILLNSREQALAKQVANHFHLDVEEYIALPVQLMVDQSRPGQIAPMQTPNGVIEMAMVPFMMILPMAHLHASKVLLPDGNAPDPLLGMLPSMEGRLVLPASRLQPQVLAALKAGDNGAN